MYLVLLHHGELSLQLPQHLKLRRLQTGPVTPQLLQQLEKENMFKIQYMCIYITKAKNEMTVMGYYRPVISAGRGTSWELAAVLSSQPRNHPKTHHSDRKRPSHLGRLGLEPFGCITGATCGSVMLSLLYSPWKDWKLSSFWLGRTGPRLGPASPREGAETVPSPRPLHCDWAYKPGGEGRVGRWWRCWERRRREEEETERGVRAET